MKDNKKKTLSKRKRYFFSFLTMLFVLIIAGVIGEIMVRIINPQPYLYPRWDFSEQYGSLLFPNTTMTHKRPGNWTYKYHVNHYRYRGEPVPISNTYDKTNIIVLGDSYTFGNGVQNGEEFAAVMGNNLKETHNVINLGVGGWGITQQIRRFYEFGQLYKPEIVVLQFCSNDLKDNFKNRVTLIENGKFKFVNSNNSSNSLKKYVAGSIIQKSQIYNLLRNSIYRMVDQREVEKELKKMSDQQKDNKAAMTYENLHGELLELFAKDLNEKGIRLMMISVNNHLEEQTTLLKSKVDELESKNYMEYHNVEPWFKDVNDFGSPEGHIWGKKGHEIIGKNLATLIKQQDSTSLKSEKDF
ncbi:SGNH/GDSL hydrolase family protein [Fulvivirgaceae bacterium BMA10]|uniref:SGNH/GDSL hydrolase family protein n=1 Tax=Splendidivirga corallicola TaxID=3051826 RepID=A0ABT8KXA7_9BACT|nr:SGNH/GDSL hydrolase family protein [Fulvivirgaceae bacterium BMA10]